MDEAHYNQLKEIVETMDIPLFLLKCREKMSGLPVLNF